MSSPAVNLQPELPEILTAEQWLTVDLKPEESEPVFGTSSTVIVGPKTKTFLEAPAKSFKTTLTMRALIGLSAGVTLFPVMPVFKKRRVLYLHGELSELEIRDRTIAAADGLPRPLDNFFQERAWSGHLIDVKGQQEIEGYIQRCKPEVLVLDSWYNFVIGYDENTGLDMGKAITFLDRMRETYGLSIIAPRHFGRDKTKKGRGASVLNDWRDNRIEVRRDKHKLIVTIDPRKADEIEFTATFKCSTVWCDDGPPWTDRDAKIRHFVISRGGQATRDEIAEFFREIKGDTLRQALHRAHNNGAVKLDDKTVIVAPWVYRPTMTAP